MDEDLGEDFLYRLRRMDEKAMVDYLEHLMRKTNLTHRDQRGYDYLYRSLRAHVGHVSHEYFRGLCHLAWGRL